MYLAVLQRYCRLFLPSGRPFSTSSLLSRAKSYAGIAKPYIPCVVFRNSSTKRLMDIRPTDFHHWKFIDSAHFFITLGALPCILIVFFVNTFIGPAVLTDIPEGYEPRYWEYHKLPISRFISKYLMEPPQMTYESNLGNLDDMREQKELIQEDRWFNHSQLAHGDYRGWYFIPANPAGVIRGKKEHELNQEIGERFSR
ncbi:unnamed protein product [Calicophoron daubneyi]|uniref:NADH dehydrogenase [ubiquinone] 1 beta subcomplex subunit 5, mitochondrial n=1 Tax=Calicophoron daubneyi TaxID=300641 RepID=A0AAV2T672_CALDB